LCRLVQYRFLQKRFGYILVEADAALPVGLTQQMHRGSRE
jgi:hypothetical protein